MSGRTLIAAVACLFCLGCGGSWPALDAKGLRADAEKTKSSADWRVVSDELVVRFLGPREGGLEVETFERRVYLVTSERIHNWRETFWYDFTHEERPRLRARLTQANGDERVLDDEAASDLPASGGVWFDDARIRHFDIGGIRPGAVLEVEARGRSLDHGRFPTARFRFGGAKPTGKARLEIIVPPGVEIEWQAEGRPFEPVKTAGAGGATHFVWAREKLPAVHTEAHGATIDDQIDRVAVTLKSFPGGQPLRTARDVSRWTESLNADRAAPTPSVRAKVAEILGGPAESLAPAERVRRLNDWVREKIRYVAIEIGMAGWQAERADRTLEILYGDCKAKAVLLKSMLEVAGVPSRLALIHAGDRPRAYKPILAAGNFNHMVLVADLPEGSRLVDPTASFVPFGEVPQADQDKAVLPVVPEGAPEPFHQPPTPAAANGLESHLALALDAQGLATGRFSLRARGVDAEGLRADLSPRAPSDRLKAAAPWLPMGELVLEALQSDRLEATADRLAAELEGTLRRRDALVLHGKTAALRVADLLGPCFTRASRGKRKTSAYFGPARRDVAELELELPAGWRAVPPAEPTETRSAVGAYTLSVEATSKGLRLKRTCERAVTTLDADRYAEYRALSDAALAAEGRPLVLEQARQ